MYASQDFDAVNDKKCFRSLSLKLENEFIVFKSAGKLLNWYKMFVYLVGVLP